MTVFYSDYETALRHGILPVLEGGALVSGVSDRLRELMRDLVDLVDYEGVTNPVFVVTEDVGRWYEALDRLVYALGDRPALDVPTRRIS